MSEGPLLRTPLHDWHQAHGGRLVEFAGWSMPVQYSTIVEEHQAVRNGVGLFDVSHMGRLHFGGADALAWLEHATTNHVAKLTRGQVQYNLMVNGGGGVEDDLLVYRLFDGSYAMVCNASNRPKVLFLLERLREGYIAVLDDVTESTAMIAVQGPRALEAIGRVVEGPFSGAKYYEVLKATALGQDLLVSRTGYTGEDGFEAIVPAEIAEPLWTALLERNRDLEARPCGLAARDTLRFEAAMPLYGHELTETINPFAAGVGWAVKLDKGDFVGCEALGRFKADPGSIRVGLALQGKRIARQGSIVKQNGKDVGLVTSGTYSPTLSQSLAMALVDIPASQVDTTLTVDVRGREEPARVVSLPFYRRAGSGKAKHAPPR